jgi:hypothetical protein
MRETRDKSILAPSRHRFRGEAVAPEFGTEGPERHVRKAAAQLASYGDRIGNTRADGISRDR